MEITFQDPVDSAAPVVITCDNWRNPILPEIVSGFTVLIMTTDRDAIDFSGDLLQIDSTEFSPMTIQDDSFEYHLSH
jgi:hypothetical protein